MELQSAHNDFIQSLHNIYPKNEAENIWKIVLEKCVPHQTFAVKSLNEVQSLQLDNILQRLLKHEPIQYIIEECWFYDSVFYVDKNVLIPRPETEELVDWIIKENKSKTEIKILDVGTGSGCIPIILKRKIPDATVYSCDVSREALKVAEKNADTHKTGIHFILLDFLDEKAWQLLPEVDIIVSNPPYIPERDKSDMRKNVLGHEPHLALFVKNNNALIFYEAIANFGLQKLNPGGAVYVEIHESLGNEILALFQKKAYMPVLKKDMQGKDRMIKAVRKK